MTLLPEIIFVIGARPNCMKVAPILEELRRENAPFTPIVVHTGQRNDAKMSDVFFRELQIQKIDEYLEIGSGTPGYQTARVCERFEQYLQDRPQTPRGVVVVGDMNSTLATALAAVKLQIPVAHVEAGLRSDDRTMPEEINRILTDAVSDLLFVSEPSGLHRLRREGIPQRKIHYVGNVMIDSLVKLLPTALAQNLSLPINVCDQPFGLVTLHRTENVDHRQRLTDLVDFFEGVAQQLPLVFPVDPRTASRLTEYGLERRLHGNPNISLLPPLSYLALLKIMASASAVLTDSGGLQEETTYLNIPCLTLRKHTERPITVMRGTNLLIGTELQAGIGHIEEILAGSFKKGNQIEGWDGQASKRIVRELIAYWGIQQSIVQEEAVCA